MGFFNMAQGDAPYFKQLAQTYALSDNYHQAILGGTGANFFAIGTGDVAVYNNSGTLATPPSNQIENPNPQSGTSNFYTQDGYSGGSYVNCSDSTQPGVSAILSVLQSKSLASKCASGAYYLVNNYNPPYSISGTANTLGATDYVYPPQTIPTIGEALSANSVSWKWYTGGRDSSDVLNDSLYAPIYALVNSQVPAATPNRSAVVSALAYSNTQSAIYNNLGDPLNASSNVVNTPALYQNLVGYQTFVNDVNNGTLPAVSFVVPKNLVSGHPGYSAPVYYELFLESLVNLVQSSSAWANTAIIITTDEGGGYFDSGAIQNLDFFGDGPRIPLLVVSPYAKKGYVDHVYHDHASILKFIEYNWGISPLSSRSRDNLPNPVTTGSSYIPSNQPAVGNLTTLFNFTTP
jgi:phospholipase C